MGSEANPRCGNHHPPTYPPAPISSTHSLILVLQALRGARTLVDRGGRLAAQYDTGSADLVPFLAVLRTVQAVALERLKAPLGGVLRSFKERA